jgi:hypothetical protein
MAVERCARYDKFHSNYMLSVIIQYICTKVAQYARPAKKKGKKISYIYNIGVSSRHELQKTISKKILWN